MLYTGKPSGPLRYTPTCRRLSGDCCLACASAVYWPPCACAGRRKNSGSNTLRRGCRCRLPAGYSKSPPRSCMSRRTPTTTSLFRAAADPKHWARMIWQLVTYPLWLSSPTKSRNSVPARSFRKRSSCSTTTTLYRYSSTNSNCLHICLWPSSISDDASQGGALYSTSACSNCPSLREAELPPGSLPNRRWYTRRARGHRSKQPARLPPASCSPAVAFPMPQYASWNVHLPTAPAIPLSTRRSAP